MARSAEQIIDDLGLLKSKQRYDQCWTAFIEFCKKEQPTEEDYLMYFDYLKRVKGFKASSIWCEYSKLNANHFKQCDKRLQWWPRVSALLKSYNAGYERKKSSPFKHSEIVKQFLNSEETSNFWILRKCAVAISYSGGLKGCELCQLACEDISKSSEGYWISYYPGKSKGETRKRKFLVPSDLTHVGAYLHRLEAFQALNGDLFKTIAKTDAILNKPMGKNMTAKFGVDVASYLNLPKPESYTGHCFCQTAAKRAADQGANLVQLKRHFNWSGQNVAMRYIDESEHYSKQMASLIAGTNDDSNKANAAERGTKQLSSTVFQISVQEGGSVTINNYNSKNE